MKIYFASPENTDFLVLKLFGVKQFLFSYHFLRKLEKKDLSKYLKAKDLFLDSGAFSAKTIGAEINLNDYIKFIKENQIENYASLDVIGDGEKTLINTRLMMDQGLKPIHTFHRKTTEEWLYKSLELDLDYIALGGMVGNKKNIYVWLDSVWNIIQKVKPEVKVHGFGCTSYELMTRYPWYSVDSTSWNSARKFGTGFDCNGITMQKNEILSKLKEIPALSFMDDGSLLLLQNVFSMLQLEEIINKEDKVKNYDYLTIQKGLFE